MKRLLILASGRGSNALNLINRFSGSGVARVVALVSNVPHAPVVSAVNSFDPDVSVIVVPFSIGWERAAFEEALEEIIDGEHIDYVLLAGFNRILSEGFVQRHMYRILNIHPSLLPRFKGIDAIERAFLSGVEKTGVTVHFATKDVDSGPIIMQKEVRIEEHDSLEDLTAKIHALEHMMYPHCVELLVEGRIAVDNGMVIYLD